MCHDWSQEYTECFHVSRKLINCPTYYKQQSSAKGFFGRLLYSTVKNRKDCGRVIPHHSDPRPFCPECTVRVDQLRAKYVGEGALKVFRPNMENDFRRPFKEHREKRKQAAEISPQRPERHVEHCKHTPKNVAVWVPELYHHPEMLARKKTCRTTEAAAPMSTSRSNKLYDPKYCSRKPVKGVKKPEADKQSSKQKSKDDRKHGCCGPSDRTSAPSHSKRPQGPAIPSAKHRYQRRREVVGDGSHIPPAPKPPPKPPRQRIRCDTGGNRPELKQYAISRKPLPSIPRPIEKSRSESSSEYPDLRRNAGQAYNTSSSKPLPNPVPPPAYQVYLNALRNPGPDFGRVEQLPRPPPKKKKHSHVAEGLRSSGLRKMMGIAPSSPDSAISDVSFMCQDSKRLTKGVSDVDGR
ncbi:uncharacterized protein F4807DRAFT_112316 [Annulohypoxylon truncatum]|uniref:uncharacterized protein n=1 Tax=Annulohypoxylon truncatum TaxID=327061 RepID=UPI002007F036|nr:uncharacterized protein F4807DRAFT_112316 [Annulohypoxylon truncatum]KAI1214048.1 hypothetical protein F4807DRAFT_112316 [Annulohypoxylon truncatum]